MNKYHRSYHRLFLPWDTIITNFLLLSYGWVAAFQPSTYVSFRIVKGDRSSLINIYAKRRKNEKEEMNQFNRWYDKVDDDATPDDVFWREMEYQKSLTPPDNDDDDIPTDDPLQAIASGAYSSPNGNVGSSVNSGGVLGKSTNNSRKFNDILEERSSDATLASYTDFMVDNNWLNEEYQMYLKDDLDILDETSLTDKELDEWERQGDNTINGGMKSNEPWDVWRREREGSNREDEDDEDDWESGVIKVDMKKAKSGMAKEFFLNDEDFQNDDMKSYGHNQESQHLEKLAEIKLISQRLEKARDNEKAMDYFARPPDEIEGYDRMWVSAIDNACMKNLIGSFRNYGCQFADNFADWENGCPEDSFKSIEDVASYKARMVHAVTGLPCIASRTSFEVEPARIPERGPSNSPQQNNIAFQNPRVLSGYRFNDVGDHVDYISDALRALSEPSRVTRFRSCFCFYDGDIEIFDYGELDCDLYFTNSLRTFIPMSSGINQLCKTLQLTFGLEFQGFMKNKVREALSTKENYASIKLRDRVLKEGKVLPNNIIDVSQFMDSKVDVNLMDDCAKELSERFEWMRPSKILTVATTGLVIAIPMAKYLQVPVVYARKERNIVMSNTWQASYSSKTVGKNRELLVSKDHIDADDRVLVIDDFLSSGSSQEALLRIISDAGAFPVGVGVLLEKAYDAGRQALSGYDIPIESLVRVASVNEGAITLVEEEGYSTK